MQRLFIALPVKKEVITLLKPTSDFLRKHNSILKVVSLDNFHITMQFLGECEDNLAEKITNNFNSINIQRDEIPFTVTGIGVFPDAQRASVIWIGLQTDERIIEPILNSIYEFTSQFGFKKEKRKFIPHLTLARVKRGKKIDKNLLEFIENNKNKRFGESSFNKLVLFSSKLTPKGPIYTELKSIDFV